MAVDLVMLYIYLEEDLLLGLALYPKGTIRLKVSPKWHMSTPLLEMFRRHPYV